MSGAAYDLLASIYDAWQCADRGTAFAETAARRLEKTLERHGPGVGSFLDLGCGTGTMLLALRRSHPTWRLAGLDASTAMLAEARRKDAETTAGAADSRPITWIDGVLPQALAAPDTADALGAAPLDAGGAFFDMLNHLPDVAALGATLGALAARLRAGGLFVFDLTNDTGFRHWWWGRRQWRIGDARLTVGMSYDEHAGVARARVQVATPRGGGEDQLSQRHFADDVVTRAADAAGFEVLEHGPWSPFRHGIAGKTWWVLRKI